MHRLNLDRRRFLLALLLQLLARLLASVHGLNLRGSVALDNRRQRAAHQPAHRGAKLLHVRLPRLVRLKALRVELLELLEVQLAVAVRVVVLHQRFREGDEFTVAHVQPELFKDLQELAALELVAAVGIELVERRPHGIRRRGILAGNQFLGRRLRHIPSLLLEFLARLLPAVHRLNLDRRRFLLALLLQLLARLLASVHGLNLYRRSSLLLEVVVVRAAHRLCRS